VLKKLLIALIVLSLLAVPVFAATCGEEEITPPEDEEEITPPEDEEEPEEGPVSGGTMKVVGGTFPAVIGYPPEFSPTDSIYALPSIERLCEWDETGRQIPVLAEDWESDPDNLTITWYLREGVTFHDGTPWNAEACQWNFQLQLDGGRLPDGQYIESLEVVDEYIFTLHLSAYNWQMFENYGWVMMISPTAFENAGATDEERIDWARSNSVGTGPFQVTDFQRDVLLVYDKNDNYWREGMPYLDGIEARYIPDPVTAAAMMEAGEADMWIYAQAVQSILDLEEMGLTVNWGTGLSGMFWSLLPNSSNPDSPLAMKEVREAIEYAIDRPAIAEMLGYGEYEPLHQLASQDWPGYVEGYDPRPYNPAMAEQLLADAGYEGGFETSILATDAARDAVAALQAYLGDVGIIVEPDIADFGRYMVSLFISGWDDLALASSGINPDATDIFVHFGPNPMTFMTGSIYKSPEYLALCGEALDPSFADAFAAMDKIKEAVVQAGEDAMIIPLWRDVSVAVMQPYVHSDYFMIHGVIWTPYDTWMDPR
jgi:peptide/nickel transport system substrate-binding protein